MQNKLDGIIPAIVSPCDDQDHFLEDVAADLAAHLFSEGVNGLYVCGATGDCYSMTTDDRKRAVEVAVQVSRPFRGQVIVHVGTHETRNTVRLAEHAAEAGAAAVAAMPPANRSYDELVAYYTDVAKAAQLPTLIYHIPPLTGHNLSLSMFEGLLSVPGVIGVKFSGSNLFLMRRLLQAHPDIAMFNGDDELLVPALLYGASGGIGMTYNLFPKFFVRLYRTTRSGDIKAAMHMQNVFMLFLDQAIRYEGLKPVFNHIMASRGFGPHCYRRPRTVLSELASQQFQSRMERYIQAVEAIGESGSNRSEGTLEVGRQKTPQVPAKQPSRPPLVASSLRPGGKLKTPIRVTSISE